MYWTAILTGVAVVLWRYKVFYIAFSLWQAQKQMKQAKVITTGDTVRVKGKIAFIDCIYQGQNYTVAMPTTLPECDHPSYCRVFFHFPDESKIEVRHPPAVAYVVHPAMNVEKVSIHNDVIKTAVVAYSTRGYPILVDAMLKQFPPLQIPEE